MLISTPVRRSLLFVVALLSSACGSEAEPGGAGSSPSNTASTASGKFSGTYEVPTAPELADAARFPIDGISWSNDGRAASLDYDLPKALVGEKLRVSFSGSVTGRTAQLTGEAGTAECDLSQAQVVCRETMRGLLPLEPDLSVVEQLAPEGAAQARVDVARTFSADPIGIATIDLTTAKTEDDMP